MLKRIFWCAAFLCCMAASLKAGNQHANKGMTEDAEHVQQLLPSMYLEDILEDQDVMEEKRNCFYAPYPLALTEEVLRFVQKKGLSLEGVLDTLRPFMSVALGSIRLKEGMRGLCAKEAFATKATLLKSWSIAALDAENITFEEMQKKVREAVLQDTQGAINDFAHTMPKSHPKLYTLAYSAIAYEVSWLEPFCEKRVHRFEHLDQSCTKGAFMVGARDVRLKETSDETIICLSLKDNVKSTPLGEGKLMWFARKPCDPKDQKSFDEDWLDDLKTQYVEVAIPCLNEKHFYEEETIFQTIIYKQDTEGAPQKVNLDEGHRTLADMKRIYLDRPHTFAVVLKVDDRYLELLSGYVATVENVRMPSAKAVAFRYPSDEDLLSMDMSEMVRSIQEHATQQGQSN